MHSPTPFRLVLVLGGGNALGSYQAGAYEALHERGYRPDWIVGTSIGAINAALIVGNAPEDRLARLNEFWRPATGGERNGRGDQAWWPSPGETLRRTLAVLSTMHLGRRGIFGPVGPLGSWWRHDPQAAAPALFDSTPLAAMLARMVDFDRLNQGDVRYTAGSVDLETGEDVFLDSAERTIRPEHVRASAALLPTFPPVAVDGRLLVDGGLSANVPLDPVLETPLEGPTLCLALNLLPLADRRPATLGEAMGRAQDLTFAAQSRRTIDRWRAEFVAAGREDAVTLVRTAYSDQDVEVAGKAMDFSPESVRHRWQAGHRDMLAIIGRVESGEIEIGRPGLTVVDP